MPRAFKWQPHDGERHAIPRTLVPNAVGRSLCDIELTAGSDVWPPHERWWPTCQICDRAWRDAEGILPWPRQGNSANTTPSGKAMSLPASELVLQP
ncbi:zinc finger protein [Lentzea sp. HUAS TT2]|uniref:zinc finger protein n=1 Tax=Lentzea sp. HUAS TT2 TaxID=3447454 RepID=UPI003F6EA011